MPPTQHFLASRLTGFVCKSCLSKIQHSGRRSLQAATRSYSSSDRSAKFQGAIQNASIRYFEQGPDGTRTEIEQNDLAEAEAMRKLERKVKELEKRTGKPVKELELDDSDIEELMGDHAKGLLRDGMEERLEQLRVDSEELEAQIKMIEEADLSNLTGEERQRLREALLGSLKKDADDPPRQIAASSAGIWRKASHTITAHPPSSICGLYLDTFPVESHPRLIILERSFTVHVKPGNALESKPLHVRAIWKAYQMCRWTLLKHRDLVPLQTWTALWDAFNADERYDQRMAHLKKLGDDMREVEVPMSPAQSLLYIEASLFGGHTKHAVKEWKRSWPLFINPNPNQDQSEIATSEPSALEYWKLGIKLLSKDGQVDWALLITGRLLRNVKEPSTLRAVMPVIQALLQNSETKAVQKAWALYVRLRHHLGDHITMEDYDKIASIFMNSNEKVLALAVFKDMMLTGQKTAKYEDSTARYISATGVTDKLKSWVIASWELEWNAPHIVGAIPHRFMNKFFFGSWVKKLIGDQDLVSAEKVFHLMHQYSISPDAIQVNGLIGAWFRQNTERYRVRAEDLAWKMIGYRLDFVRRRDEECKGQGHEPIAEEGLKTPKIPTPPATLETFAILFEHYKGRQRGDQILVLIDFFQQAKIQPTTAFMNQLLSLQVKEKPVVAWLIGLYQELIKKARPDIETFEILWLIMKRIADPLFKEWKRPPAAAPLFGSSRHLFAEMVKQRASLQKRASRTGFPISLYQEIILAFSQEMDLLGTAIALRAFQEHYSLLPTGETVRTIVLQVARFELVRNLGYNPTRLDPQNMVTKEMIDTATTALEEIMAKRVKALQRVGIVYEELQSDARSKETLNMLVEYLKYASQVKYGTVESAILASRKVAEAMDVPDFDPWKVESVVG